MSNIDTELEQQIESILQDFEWTPQEENPDNYERVLNGPQAVAALKALIQARDTAHKEALLKAVGEIETPGKRGTEDYTRKYVVDIRNDFREQLLETIQSIYRGTQQ